MQRVYKRRRAPLGIVALLALVCWLWISASDLQAHALLVRSVPEAGAELAQPPQTIEMWFSEPLESTFSSAHIVDSSGAEITTGAALVDSTDRTHMTLPLGDLPPGYYTVVWRTLSSVDGHEWVGSFPITILLPDGARPTGESATVAGSDRGELPTPMETAARWFSLMGIMLLLGAIIFRLVAAAPLFGQGGSPQQPSSRDPAVLLLQGMAIFCMAGGVAIVVGGWLQLVVQSLRLGGLQHLSDLALWTRPGNLIFLRQLLTGVTLLVILSIPLWPQRRGLRPWLLVAVGGYTLLIFMATMGIVLRDSQPIPLLLMVIALGGVAVSALYWGDADDDNRSLRLWMLLLLGIATASTFSLGSHAAAVAGSGWAILSDWVHLVTAAAWLGGLFFLAWLLWQRYRRSDVVESASLGRIVRRYSYLASLAIFVLALTGLFSSLVQLPTLVALWTTAYGWVLLAKLALVGLALAVALLNNRVVHGAAQTLQPPGEADSFLRRVTLESSVGVGVMLAVALLVQTPVPQGAPPPERFVESTFNDILLVDDLRVHLQISPNQAGNNRHWIHLYHADGSPIGDVQLVRLLFAHQNEEMGQSQVDLAPLGQDTFAVEGAYLNRAGEWDISLYVRRRAMDDALTRVSVDVAAPMGAAAGGTPWQNPVPGMPGGVLVAGLIVGLGAMPFLWMRPLLRRSRRVYPVFATLGGIFLVIGLLVGYTSFTAAVATGVDPGLSPPMSAESIAAGALLYQQECAACHGQYGLGNGPAAAGLPVAPAVLPFHVPKHEDPELYAFIYRGFPSLGMPAYGEILTQEELWQLVHYLRAEFGPGA
jgi:putative copper export protein/methionine-rich copper-binding protein CopC/mono/diheme cytochrome c family protein